MTLELDPNHQRSTRKVAGIKVRRRVVSIRSVMVMKRVQGGEAAVGVAKGEAGEAGEAGVEGVQARSGEGGPVVEVEVIAIAGVGVGVGAAVVEVEAVISIGEVMIGMGVLIAIVDDTKMIQFFDSAIVFMLFCMALHCECKPSRISECE
jgi:hypothetical protein